MGVLEAAVTTFDGLTYETPLTTLSGWTASEVNNTSHLIAWVENNNGGFGGAYAAGNATPVTLTLASSIFSSVAGVSMEVALYDSSVADPGRDTFSIGITDGSGAALVTMVFAPAVSVGGQARWEVGYSIGTGVVNYTGRTFAPGPADYDVSVDFTGSDFVFTYGNSLGTESVNGVIPGFDGATAGVGDIKFIWTKSPTAAYGSNYITFDNIAVVPEPATLALSSFAGAFLLIRRRR
jgi:hypothetical protein